MDRDLVLKATVLEAQPQKHSLVLQSSSKKPKALDSLGLRVG